MRKRVKDGDERLDHVKADCLKTYDSYKAYIFETMMLYCKTENHCQPAFFLCVFPFHQAFYKLGLRHKLSWWQ